MGEVLVAFMAQATAAQHLARAGGGECVLPHIHPQHATGGHRRRVGEVEDEVQRPDALANNEARFLGGSAGQEVSLMATAGKGDPSAPGGGEEREHLSFQRVGPMVEVDRSRPKGKGWNGLVFGEAPVGLERLVGVGNPAEGLADHLAAQRRKALAEGVISEVVQRDPVPTPVLLNKGDQRVAGVREGLRERGQGRGLLGGGLQLQGHRPLHVRVLANRVDSRKKPRRAGAGRASHGTLSLPAQTGGVSRVK